MNFKEGAPLIDGYPWGFGAKTVKHAPKHWKYACCGKTVKKNHDALHIFEDGDMTCSACAEKWAKVNFIPPALPEPIALNEQGQLVLGDVA